MLGPPLPSRTVSDEDRINLLLFNIKSKIERYIYKLFVNASTYDACLTGALEDARQLCVYDKCPVRLVDKPRLKVMLADLL